MLYDLTDFVQRERFQRRCASLVQRQGRVELREMTRRTLSQNAYLHLLLGYFASETGYTLDFVKREYFKRLVNPDIFQEERDGAFGRVADLRSTAQVGREELSLAIDRFRNWSSETAGIYLPSANEEEFLKSIEMDIDRYSHYTSR